MTQTQDPLLSSIRRKPRRSLGSLLAALNHAALCLMVSVGHRPDCSMRSARCRRPHRPRSPHAPGSMNGTCASGWGRWLRPESSNCDSGDAAVLAAAGTRRVSHARGRRRQHGRVRSVRRSARRVWRTTSSSASRAAAACRIQVHALPRGDGGRQRAVRAVLARNAHPSTGAGLTDRLSTGIRVLDAGCGSGRILNRLAGLYPRSRFVGMDLSSDATAPRARGCIPELVSITSRSSL